MKLELKPQLGSHEVQLLSYLSDRPRSISQRHIAESTGLSVGLVNAILKKLINTGYVKISHLNKKQVQYFLTTEGFSQKLVQSYSYIVDTIGHYKKLEQKISDMVVELYSQGYEKFYIEGNGAVRDLIELAFRGKLQPLPISLRKELTTDD